MDMIAKALSSLPHKNLITHFKQSRISHKLKQRTFLLYVPTGFKKTYAILSLIVISAKVAVLPGAFALHKLRAEMGEDRRDGILMQVKASSVNR